MNWPDGHHEEEEEKKNRKEWVQTIMIGLLKISHSMKFLKI